MTREMGVCGDVRDLSSQRAAVAQCQAAEGSVAVAARLEIAARTGGKRANGEFHRTTSGAEQLTSLKTRRKEALSLALPAYCHGFFVSRISFKVILQPNAAPL